MTTKTQQIVFIDDSGDPGFNIANGATTHFVIACIVFNDTLVAEETAIAIKKYRRSLGFSDRSEFKFAKSSDAIKIGFLKIIAKYDFRIRAVVVDKHRIRSQELQTSHDSFYNYFIKQVLLHSKGSLKDSKIRLDGHGNKLFKKNLTTYLRRELNNRHKKIMRNMRLVDSTQDVLIQMADMIAGAIRRSCDKNKPENKIYRQLINKKIEDCWEFK
ncbi:MAG: hypothetical protein DPW11_00195 [bacterium]|nr:DUF3800 domain-containing protein [Candidatus Microgenomates bacterium CPR3]MCQ3944190.1 hypothetical protein [bacterium]RIK51969.1 MAG: hypothetical protein DCC61_01100 [Candidatus Microgenomates bacterium]